ncbi:MAG TPA: hypothetical protein VF517_06715 [Thermoleophilaceae bacterium]|jgi:prefoldin subunit 5
MERTLWTDERIDDTVARIEARFEQVEARLDRVEARLDRLEARIDDLYRQAFNFAIVQFTALLGLFVTILLRT